MRVFGHPGADFWRIGTDFSRRIRIRPQKTLKPQIFQKFKIFQELPLPKIFIFQGFLTKVVRMKGFRHPQADVWRIGTDFLRRVRIRPPKILNPQIADFPGIATSENLHFPRFLGEIAPNESFRAPPKLIFGASILIFRAESESGLRRSQTSDFPKFRPPKNPKPPAFVTRRCCVYQRGWPDAKMRCSWDWGVCVVS